jgi:hypothetical protein
MTIDEIVKKSATRLKKLSQRLHAGGYGSPAERQELLEEIEDEKDYCQYVIDNGKKK